jgi:hypothetical protein
MKLTNKALHAICLEKLNGRWMKPKGSETRYDETVDPGQDIG